MIKNWKVPTNEAIDAFRGREKLLSRMLKHLPHLCIDFKDKKHIKDKDIKKMIIDKWGDINEGVQGKAVSHV
jgi:hypothetical protein